MFFTLQKVKASIAVPSGDTKQEPEHVARQCDMCANYEKQLVSEQANADAAKDRASTLELALKQVSAAQGMIAKLQNSRRSL